MTRCIAALLMVGMLLTACAEAEQAGTAAEVVARALDVASGQLDGELVDMEPDEVRPLSVGDAVTVDGAGEALLRFTDFLLVRLFRDSSLRLEATADPDAPPWAELRLEAGTVLADLELNELAEERLEINTEAAQIRVVGTEFLVHTVESTQVTWVVVREGVVAVTGAGSTVEVEAGFATFVVPGEAPRTPFPATRSRIGDGLPPLDALTNGALSDADVLLPDDIEATEDDGDDTGDGDGDGTGDGDDTDGDGTDGDDGTGDGDGGGDGTGGGGDETDPPPDDVTLSVEAVGDGDGVIIAPGIQCGDDCTETYPSGTDVEVVARAVDGSTFDGWATGCGAGTALTQRGTCAMTLTEDTRLQASFLAVHTVAVVVEGEGAVDVAGRECIRECQVPVASGQEVTLSARDVASENGWTFTTYQEDSGLCGDDRTCTFTVTRDVTVAAIFTFCCVE